MADSLLERDESLARVAAHVSGESSVATGMRQAGRVDAVAAEHVGRVAQELLKAAK